MNHLRDRGEWQTSEALTLSGLDLPVEHYDDYADAKAGRACFDAVSTAPIAPCRDLPIIGLAYLKPGSRLELKTCQVWINDGTSRRRGRLTLYEENHRRRLEERIPYLVGVREDVEDVDLLAASIVSADSLDDIAGDRWTATSRNGGGRTAQIPWNKVLSRDLVDERLADQEVDA